MEVPSSSTSYNVHTPVYEGPLDLLLQLIEHAELDITSLALAQVTDQFLNHLRDIQVPAEEISFFLVVAAKLLQIKSEALLPRPPIRTPEEEDPGEALARQLRIYKRFKEIAIWLDAQSSKDLHTYLHLAHPPKVEGKLDLSGVTLNDLLEVARFVYSQEQEKTALGSIIAVPKITIREKIALIAAKLGVDHQITFTKLLGQRPTRLEIVVTFLALLELVKRYRVSATQDGLFSEIQIEQLDDLGAGEELEIEFD